MLLKDYPEKIQPYVFHGVKVSPTTNGSSKADCPFCGREGHMGIKVETGQFRCVRCETSGNIYNFLEALHKEAYTNTKEEDYQKLSLDRGISVRTLQRWGFVISPLTGEWLKALYNTKGKHSNTLRIVESEKGGKIKYQALSTPGCKLQLIGTELLTLSQKYRYVCEGIWDAPRLWELFNSYADRDGRFVKVASPDKSLGREIGVVGMPGASSFQVDWFAHFSECTIHICGDNDYPKFKPDHTPIIMKDGEQFRPGWHGTKKIFDLAAEIPSTIVKPSSIRYLKWGETGHTEDLADGYDVRDLCNTLKPDQVLKFLKDHSFDYLLPKKKRTVKQNKKEEEETIEPLECTSFEELCKVYEEHLHFSKQMRDTLAIMLATIVSTELPEDPLWIRVIGPPGSGKTTLAEACSVARKWITPLSVLTGFHSGFVDMEDRSKDTSIINELMGKTIIMKDADTLVKSGRRDTVMSELRDMYDGSTRAAYRNQKRNNYENVRITFILCGTGSLRALSKDTYLGERFLDCEIIDETFDATPIIAAAMSNAWSAFTSYDPKPKEDHEAKSEDSSLIIKRKTFGYIKYLKENFTSLTKPSISPENKKSIESLAVFLSYMRARVQRTGESMDYRPQIEVGGRLSKQLSKLVYCTSLVHQKDKVDQDIMALARKMVLDTCKSFQFEITNCLINRPEGLSVQQLRNELQLPDTTIRNWIQDMQELKIITRSQTNNNSGQRGRDTHLWKLSPNIIQVWQSAFHQQLHIERKKSNVPRSRRQNV